MSRILLLLLAVNLFTSGYAQSDFDVVETSISDLQTALQSGRVTSLALVEQYLARIDAYDKQGSRLNSIVRINPRAMEIAAALDRERQQTGPRSRLHGIPILVKDNYNTVDMPTTGGSVALANFIPSENATQINKLIDAGAIILAKTNLHEFAFGVTSVSSLLGQTRNPYDIRRVPGGSSGGTGAAVAASFAAIGLGSDTCGSIRIPSAFNNLIGLRPSKGLSSIHGVMPLSHTQDVAGPLARTAEDLAILLDIVVGYDPQDSATSIMESGFQPNFQATLGSVDLNGLRFGRLVSYFDNADGGTRSTIQTALDWYEEQGVEIIDVEIPDLESLISRSGLIFLEFQTDLDAYLARFGSEAVASLNEITGASLHHEAVTAVLNGSQAASRNEDSYARAVANRQDVRLAVEQVFEEHNLDAIVYPPIGELPVFIGNAQPGNNCSISANSGLPALSMQAGFSSNGLPVGMELLGQFLDDARLLAMAYPYEQQVSVRRAPSVTPPLIDGEAPPARRFDIAFDRGGVVIKGSLQIDLVINQLSYELQLDDSSSNELFAATLAIEESIGTPGPIALNMMGPGVDSASGSYFISPDFWRALDQGRLTLRIFAQGFPAEGLIQAVP